MYFSLKQTAYLPLALHTPPGFISREARPACALPPAAAFAASMPDAACALPPSLAIRRKCSALWIASAAEKTGSRSNARRAMFGRISLPNVTDRKHATAKSLRLMLSTFVGWKPGTRYTIGWLQKVAASTNALASSPRPPPTKMARAGSFSYMSRISRVKMFSLLSLRDASPIICTRAEPPQTFAMRSRRKTSISRRHPYTLVPFSWSRDCTKFKNFTGSASAGR